jgi:hypothetical protein
MRSRLTPAIVIVASVLVTASIIGGELFLLAKFDKVAANFGLPQLSTATMPDGSVLTLHAVSCGRKHSLSVPVFPPGIRWGAQPVNLQTLNHPTHVDCVVFIVSCHDPESRAFSDFAWWSHCLLQDAHGDDIMDQRGQRLVYWLAGSASQWSNRRPPFKPLERHLASATDKRVLLAIEFPALRAVSAGSLKFFNLENQEVASVPFVPTWSLPEVEWAPQPLPVTGDHGEVSLVLKDVRLRAHDRSSGESEAGPRWQLECDTELLQGGEPAQHWSRGLLNVSDVLGNEASPWDVTLSRKEPAWRVRFQATRRIDAEFSDDERLTISGIRVLQDNSFDTELTTVRESSEGLSPVASTGVGRLEFHIRGYGWRNRNLSAGGNIPIVNADRQYAAYRLEWRNDGSPRGERLTLDTPMPCLILQNVGLPAGSQILVRTRDSQGREVSSHLRRFYDVAYLVFFDASPDVGELTCELLLQTPLEFEFFIQPPEPETVR